MAIEKKSLIANREATKKAIIATNRTTPSAESVKSNVKSNVRSSVRSNVRSSVRSNVRSSVRSNRTLM